MTQVNINFSDTGFTPVPQYNTFTKVTAGSLSSDLLDSSGSPTGIGLVADVSMLNGFKDSGYVDQDHYGIPQQVWEDFFFTLSTDPTPKYRLTGFAAGQAVDVALAGFKANANWDVEFVVNGVTKSYVNLGLGAPSVPSTPVVFSAIADASGDIAIEVVATTTYAYLTLLNISYVSGAGPTITGPDSTTEGSTTVQAGTLLDTVVTQSLISGSYSIEQTIDSATATTLNYVAESGVNQCTPSTPVSGVPLEPTISAAGITPYVVQQEADDGVNPPATRNITLNPEATHEVIQTMIAVSNTTPDQSIFGTNIIIVEDDMQAYVPKTANGMTITWSADGTFTTGMVDQTEVIDVAFFSPATGQWSCIELTIQNSSIVGSRSSFGFPNFQFPTLDTTH